MRSRISTTVLVGLCHIILAGCANSPSIQTEGHLELPRPVYVTKGAPAGEFAEISSVSLVRPVNYPTPQDDDSKSDNDEKNSASNDSATNRVDFLIKEALDRNPRLARLHQEYQAASARSQYVDKLPDPKLGANFFGNPLETATGSQRSNMHLSQKVPWFGRLDAEKQRADYEAMAVRADFIAEQLRVIAGIRAGWYRLYVIGKQIEIANANQDLLNSLIAVANARIATGNASQGDVLLGTLELSQLEERLLTYHKQRRAVEVEVNRLVGRSANISIDVPAKLNVGIVELSAAEIHQISLENQPEIEAARLRTQATQQGIEVARLRRRPEMTFSASYFFTDGNRPPSSVIDVGEDPWAVGVQVSLPLWRQKYDAIENEAKLKHQAAHSSVKELSDRYDALILDLVTEAKRSAETVRLYRATILPQARQTLSADQKSYSNGTVEFDRVIQDYRNLLTLEVGYHKSLGDVAVTHTRLQQAAGQDLEFTELLDTSSEEK